MKFRTGGGKLFTDYPDQNEPFGIIPVKSKLKVNVLIVWFMNNNMLIKFVT